ncbi:MAG: hypothetical protein R3D33_08510 [Hyphomicrobiaceae bacterium]
MGIEARRLQADRQSGVRIGPDPLSAVLPALSALGAIASIAAIMWVAEAPEGERQKPRRKVAVAIRDLESDCLILQEVFRRFPRILKIYGGDRPVVTAPAKFGLNGLKTDAESHQIFQSIMVDLARVLPSSAENAFDVMCAVEDGAIDAPEAVFYGFGECQERLNKLLTERASLKSSIETGLEVSARLTALVKDLKRYAVA